MLTPSLISVPHHTYVMLHCVEQIGSLRWEMGPVKQVSVYCIFMCTCKLGGGEETNFEKFGFPLLPKVSPLISSFSIMGISIRQHADFYKGVGKILSYFKRMLLYK